MMIWLLVLSVAALASTAKAVPENPQETFDFTIFTFGSHACWYDTFENTGYPQYNYTWEITEVLLSIEDVGFINIIDGIPDAIEPVPDEVRSGTGTGYGIPFEILSHRFEEQDVFAVDIRIDVAYTDGSAVLRVCADELVDFGSLDGHAVGLFALEGTAAVTAIIEPATIGLLGLGGLALICRGRRV